VASLEMGSDRWRVRASEDGGGASPADSDGRGAAVADAEPAVSTETKPAPPRLDKLPPYRVLLHNDDVNDMLWVVDALAELTPLNREQAVEVMLRAHTRGLSQVLVTHRERAELYVDQLRTRKLVATAEPAG
jgi:ATP-dependent Clp protease adaptor protein ClpS